MFSFYCNAQLKNLSKSTLFFFFLAFEFGICNLNTMQYYQSPYTRGAKLKYDFSVILNTTLVDIRSPDQAA